MDPAKIRAKVAAELTSLFRDENAHLERFKRIRTWIRVIGIGCILAGLYMIGSPWHWPTATAAFFSVVGGFLCGLSIAYDTSMQSWPVIKSLLKDNALELLTEGDTGPTAK